MSDEYLDPSMPDAAPERECSRDTQPISIVTFTGMRPDSGVFEYESERVDSTELNKRMDHIPQGLVAVLEGLRVDVTDPFYIPLSCTDESNLAWKSPKDIRRLFQHNPSGLERLAYAVGHIATAGVHPGLFIEYLVSGEPIDYAQWMSLHLKPHRKVGFTFKGVRRELQTVLPVQVAMDALLEPALDPSVLVHALYQLEVGVVDAMADILPKQVRNGRYTEQQAAELLGTAHAYRAALEQELSRLARTGLRLYIVD